VEGCLASRDRRDAAAQPAALLRHARARVALLRRVALETIAEARSSDDDARLHQGRVDLKRWRYALESMAATDAISEAPLAELRVLQQALGAVNDAAVMRDYLQRRATRNRARGRPARAASLEQALASCEAVVRRERLRLSEQLLASGLAAAS
jgi:CHAD domain-containing protein